MSEQTSDQGGPEQPQLMRCARHPDRPTGLSCSRCGRPACPDCLREASVGYQCVDCVRAGEVGTRRPTTVAGAQLRQGAPLITFALIAINVAVYLVTAVQASSVVNNERSELMNAWVLSPDYMAASDEWYRLVTSGFLHFGPIHILANMVSLYIIGREVEVVLGRLRFLGVYLMSLLGGGVAAFLFSAENSAVAGASGAVFGLMGALGVAVVRLKLDPKPVLFLIVVNLFISFQLPGISWQAHLGGLVVGLVLMAAMVYPPPARRNVVQIGAFVGVLIVLVALYFVRNSMLAAQLTG